MFWLLFNNLVCVKKKFFAEVHHRDFSASVERTLKEQVWQVKVSYKCICSPVDSSVQCMLHETSTQL